MLWETLIFGIHEIQFLLWNKTEYIQSMTVSNKFPSDVRSHQYALQYVQYIIAKCSVLR